MKGLPYLQPLYTTEDAKMAADHFVAVEYDQWFTIDENIDVMYSDGGPYHR